MASLVNAPGVDSYPITSFTWIYLRAKPLDPARAAALDNLLSWGYSDGQTVAEKDAVHRPAAAASDGGKEETG
jgi:ABC-type phosphate transport system substrate-binding protein